MGNLQVFKYENNDVRTVEMNGEPWFVGKDVAAALGYGKGKSLANAVTNHVDSEDKGVTELMTPGGKQNVTIINESGLYSLILSSKLPTAKQFKRWVTAEVLPAIRKNGGYIAGQETMTDAELMSQALLVAQKTLETRTKRLEELATKNKQLESKNAEMTGKARYFDAVIDRNLLTNFRTFASELHIKQTVLVQFLLDKKYLYRDTQGKLKAYAERNDGLFDIKEFVNRGNGHAGTQTLITPKGRETFRLLMEAEGLIGMSDDTEDMADAG
jgi:prophage antirepressor-like protein